MTNTANRAIVYVISDSVGETAELVVKAAASQFDPTDFDVRRVPYVEDTATIHEVMTLAKETKAIVAFTLVVPELREFLLDLAAKEKIQAVDIIGPMMDHMESVIGKAPRNEPGLVHKLDEDYFRRVEAIEFAVKYDDGRDPRGIALADIVLVGVSRTSKTPLSQYLAHKRLKVANVPIVPEVDPPEELFSVAEGKCYALKISPEKLNNIRKERLIALGLNAEASYANMSRINEELEYFNSIIEKMNCQVIDVSNRAVEETANLILSLYKGKHSS